MSQALAVMQNQSQREIRDYHLRYPDKKWATFNEGGATYTRPVSYGMPKIDPAILDSAFFLYENVDDARRGAAFGGTGFLVSYPMPIKNRPEKPVAIYGVTNWHVVCQDGFSIIRLNKKDGTHRTIETDPSDWHFIEGGNDVAVIHIPINQDEDQFCLIPIALFLSQDDERIGVGDDVFMIGRFIDYDGVERNAPSARFGNISMMPQPVQGKESYCVDMHSRSGFSGSPVFVY